MANAGTWIQTYSGRQFWPLEPRVEDIEIEDIAHALSNVCRYTGHCRTFYSVAQHCVLVSAHLPPELARWGLLHDAPEAYIADLARPVKRAIPAYREIEGRLEKAVAERFAVSTDAVHDERVKWADLQALATERRDLMGPPPAAWNCLENVAPWPERIVPVSPLVAKRDYLRAFALTLPPPQSPTIEKKGTR